MVHRISILCIASIVFAADSADVAKRWWAHVQVLAADNMEGRDTGSEGYRRAARYVVEQFGRDGLKPSGVSGYYQPVPLRAIRVASQSAAWLITGDTKTPLELNRQIAFTPRAAGKVTISGPLVFLGGSGDGLDIKEKIAVVLAGSPRGQNAAERARALTRAGASGVLSIDNPRAIEPPRWPAAYSTTMSVDSGEPAAGASQLGMRFNPAFAERLFRSSEHSFQEIVDLAAAGKPLPNFELKPRLAVSLEIGEEKLSSDNLLALLPGTDPALANEIVVVSAHLDAYGFGEPVNGDRIYNGALDDAGSVANLLELAADLHRSGKPFRRSLLFAVFTGEEKGLLGSNYFVAHPTVAKERMVADINLDYLRPIFPLKILTTLGLEESTLGDSVRKVAEPMGIRIQNDDEPERGLFRRSDQYNFIRNGIPGVAFIFGYDKGSPEEATYRKWYADRYHRPSDDLNQPVDMAAAAKFQEFFEKLAATVGNASERPAWHASSVYKTTKP